MSQYTLRTPHGTKATCLDIRAGCPAKALATP
jgi:hypothetical protein